MPHAMPSLITMIRLALVISLLCSMSSVHALAQSNPASPLGTNLSGVSYYTSEQPFLNIFKTGGGWYTQVRGGVWDTGEENLLNLDANGYPICVCGIGGQTVTFNQVSVLLLRNIGTYPAGQYVVLYDGEGTISYSFDAVKNAAASIPGRDVLNVTPTNGGGILISITATDPNRTGNYIRNIRLVYAPNEPLLGSGAIFNPDLINRIGEFRALRFMDWGMTNSSTEGGTWSARNTPSSAFWGAPLGGGSTRSVPIEVMVALSNQLQADPWFNIPHLASDDYINQFATLVHQQLASNRNVYVEYSNETWNYIFPQTQWMTSQGVAMWPSARSPFDANRSYYGMRAAQMCKIWKSAWGADANRVQCVLAAQAANTYTATQSLRCPLWAGAPCSQYGFSALAIAPYFGYGVPDAWTPQPDGGLTSLFTEIMQGGLVAGGYPAGMIQQALNWVSSYVSVANSYGLPLIAYEGGQSLVNSNDAALTNLYIAANRDPRMGTAYSAYLQGWKNAGGQLFVHFSDIVVYSKWGSWGSLENVIDTGSPKYNALTNFISQNPCWWSGCITTALYLSKPDAPITATSAISVAPVSPSSYGTPSPSVWVGGQRGSGGRSGNFAMSGYAPSPAVYGTPSAYTWIGNSARASGTPAGTATGGAHAAATVGNGAFDSSMPSTGPTVAITSPATGAALRGDVGQKIEVSATSPTGISSLTILSEGRILEKCVNATSCSASWLGTNALVQGARTISAIAIDTAGNRASTSVTIEDLK
jgi:hypothetical protein